MICNLYLVPWFRYDSEFQKTFLDKMRSKVSDYNALHTTFFYILYRSPLFLPSARTGAKAATRGQVIMNSKLFGN